MKSIKPYDVVCFSHLRWSFVFQRPQHLMTRFARDARVFYVEEPSAHTGAPRLDVHIDEAAGGVHVVTPRLSDLLTGIDRTLMIERLLLRFYDTRNIDLPLAWYYSPMFLPATRNLRARAVVYDCMDELSAFKNAPPELPRLEEKLLARASVVFTGGQSLYEAKRDKHENIHPFPSAVDIDHFGQARALRSAGADAQPADQRDIPGPRIGFYGVIDERMDTELVREVARLRPDWHLVLIGPVVKIDPASLPQAPNIHWLGMKKYEELPSYLAGWDVAMLPFAVNEATRFISPTKTPEYMAGGLPVVSTPIRDVVRTYGERGLVEIATDAPAFVQSVETLLAQDADERIARHDEILADMSWDATFTRMTELIEAATPAFEHDADAWSLL